MKIVQIQGRTFLFQGCLKVFIYLDFQKQYNIIKVKKGNRKLDVVMQW